MKTILILCLLFSFNINAQWVSKKIDNGFDSPYIIAYTNDNQHEFLKLENYNGTVLFYISNTYICDDVVKVDISFLVNGEYQKYISTCKTSTNNETVFIVEDMNSNLEFLANFKAATSIKIRIHDTLCDTEIYEFSMSGSTAALNAVIKQ